jgi:hypothetical protein
VGVTGVATDPKVAEEIKRFFARHGVKSIVMSAGNMGCRHEEGEDFPDGEECPFCPFWRGKQGIGGRYRGMPEDGFEDDADDVDVDVDVDVDDDVDDADDEFDDADNAIDVGAGATSDSYHEKIARVERIIGGPDKDFAEAIDLVVAHLQANLRLPCEVTGMEDFQWEEPYVHGGWSQQKYKRLRKSQPSYRDRFELLSIERGEESEWMLYSGDVCAHVRRKSDRKEFVLGLSELRVIDKASPDYELLDDYCIWFANSR